MMREIRPEKIGGQARVNGREERNTEPPLRGKAIRPRDDAVECAYKVAQERASAFQFLTSRRGFF